MADIENNKEQLDNNASTIQAIKTSEFMKETIKQRPINRRKLARRLIITVTMAILFGFIACFTFLFLEPIIDKKLNPPEENEIKNITFVEENIDDEMLPTDMIVEESELQTANSEQLPLADEQIEQVLNEIKLGADEYISLSQVVTQMASEVGHSIVTVVGITQDVDWFNNEYSNEERASGVIVADNGRDLLILTDLRFFTDVDELKVTFFDESTHVAQMVAKDVSTGLAIVSVNKTNLKRYTAENVSIINMAITTNKDLNGIPVVALGRPLDIDNSIGIGHITSCKSIISMTDANYKLLTTDIAGSNFGSGFLVNIKGQLIGVIDMSSVPGDLDNLVCGIAISELKKLIETLSNGNEIPYLGLSGMDVTQSISESLGIPVGVYIKTIDMDSPIMNAGIQSGDIITKVNDIGVTTFQDVNNIRLSLEPEEEISLEVMRQRADGYTAMDYTVILGHQE